MSNLQLKFKLKMVFYNQNIFELKLSKNNNNEDMEKSRHSLAKIIYFM